MTIDRYTRAMLTVIAGCLLWICAMGIGRPIAAQPATADLSTFQAGVQPVVIVGTGSMDQNGNIAVKLLAEGGMRRTDPSIAVTLPYTPAKPLPVGMPYTTANPMPSQLFYTPAAPLPVEITAVKKTGDWEPLRAEVEDAPVRKTPGIPK
jgi:hypothetical protein